MSFEKRKAVPLAAAFLIAVGIGSTATADTGVEIYSTNVTLNGGDIGLGGGDIRDSGVVVWNSSQGFVPAASVEVNPIQSGTTSSDVGLGQVENEAQVAESGDSLSGDINFSDNQITNLDAVLKNDGSGRLRFGRDLKIDGVSYQNSLHMQGNPNLVLGNRGSGGTVTISDKTGGTGEGIEDVRIHDAELNMTGNKIKEVVTIQNRGNKELLRLGQVDTTRESGGDDFEADVEMRSRDSILFLTDMDGDSGGEYSAYLDGSNGNWNVQGTKNWVHQINTTHNSVYSSQESPEVRAVYEGQTTTSNGRVNVSLPSHFSKTVSDTRPSLRAQATPHRLATVAVTERTDDYLVIESSKDVAVDYRVTGIREGYEDKQVVRKK